MCFICGRSNCCPMFHSTDEEAAFRNAEIAYNKFLEVWRECKEAYQDANEKQDSNDQD